MAPLTRKPSLKERLVAAILRFLDLEFVKENAEWLDRDILTLDTEIQRLEERIDMVTDFGFEFGDDLDELADRFFELDYEVNKSVDDLAQDVAEHIYAEYWDGADVLFGTEPDHGPKPEQLPSALENEFSVLNAEFAEQIGLAAEPLTAASEQHDDDPFECWGC